MCVAPITALYYFLSQLIPWFEAYFPPGSCQVANGLFVTFLTGLAVGLFIAQFVCFIGYLYYNRRSRRLSSDSEVNRAD